MTIEEAAIRTLSIPRFPVGVSPYVLCISSFLGISEVFSIEGITRWLHGRDLCLRADLVLIHKASVSGPAD